MQRPLLLGSVRWKETCPNAESAPNPSRNATGLEAGNTHELKPWLLSFWLCVPMGSQLIFLNLIFLICQRGTVLRIEVGRASQVASADRTLAYTWRVVAWTFFSFLFSLAYSLSSFSRKQVPHPPPSFQFLKCIPQMCAGNAKQGGTHSHSYAGGLQWVMFKVWAEWKESQSEALTLNKEWRTWGQIWVSWWNCKCEQGPLGLAQGRWVFLYHPPPTSSPRT